MKRKPRPPPGKAYENDNLKKVEEEMKEETRRKKNSDGKLLIGIVAVIVILIIVLCILLVRRNNGGQTAPDADYLAEQMELSGREDIPDDPEQIREIAETALSVLNGTGPDTDRTQMEEALKNAILKLGYGLTEEEAGTLAEWLTSLYLNGNGTAGTAGSQGGVTNVDSAVYHQIKSDLDEMAAYLEKLDESVTNRVRTAGKHFLPGAALYGSYRKQQYAAGQHQHPARLRV